MARKYQSLLKASFFSLILCGCYGTVKPHEVPDVEFGTLRADYQAAIQANMSTHLYDPYSAVFDFGNPCKAATITPLWIGEHKYGWLVPGTINAKNRFGGYTGAQPYRFFLEHGAVVSITGVTAHCIDGSF